MNLKIIVANVVALVLSSIYYIYHKKEDDVNVKTATIFFTTCFIVYFMYTLFTEGDSSPESEVAEMLENIKVGESPF